MPGSVHCHRHHLVIIIITIIINIFSSSVHWNENPTLILSLSLSDHFWCYVLVIWYLSHASVYRHSWWSLVFGDDPSSEKKQGTDPENRLWVKIFSFSYTERLGNLIFSLDKHSGWNKFDNRWNFVSRLLVWLRGRAGVHNWSSWRPCWREWRWRWWGGWRGWGELVGRLGRWLGLEEEEEEGNPFLQVR